MSQADKIGLLRRYDLDELRTKVKQAPFADSLRQMKRQFASVAKRDSETTVIRDGGWCHSRFFTPMVIDAGFLYAIDGDEEGARHVERQIDKLARVYANPPQSFDDEIEGMSGKPSAYFSNAQTAIGARMCWEGLTEEHRDRLLKLMLERLIDDCHKPEYYLTHFNAGHNAITTHVVSAAICALLFGEECGHPEAERMIELGRDACEAHLHWAYDDQGAPHEGPMYSVVTLEWVYLYADLLRRHDGEDLFKTQPRMEVLPQAIQELQYPGWVGMPGFDDCRRLVERNSLSWLLLTDREYDRPLDKALWYRWREEDLALGKAPTDHSAPEKNWLGVREILWWDGETPVQRLEESNLPTAYFGMGKGVAMLRSSWQENATCVNVLGQGRSHNIPDHTHADAGHFSLFTHGELLAYDTAYFNFDEDTHSVVLIDDTPHCPSTQGNNYAGRFATTGRHELLDWVTVDAAAAKGCMWAERTVLFIRGEGEICYAVTLDNINVDNGMHNFKWQLQGNLHCRIEVEEDQASVIGERARLDCHFISPDAEDFPTAPHSLKVWNDDHEHIQIWNKVPETNPRLVAEQEGPNCTLMAIVIPRALNQEALIVTQSNGYRTLVATVEHGAFVDQIVYACDHTFVRLPNLTASSEMVVVRRDWSGKVVFTWTNDGKPVKAT
ncbi:MAG: hypothetical protein ACYTGH_01320 [Planctomycetota bacterium]